MSCKCAGSATATACDESKAAPATAPTSAEESKDAKAGSSSSSPAAVAAAARPAYDPAVYAALPTIRQAHDALDEVLPKDMEAISRLFVGHGVHDRLGLCLLHRHFDLAADERLVETVQPKGPPELYEFCSTCTGHDVISKTSPVRDQALGVVSAHSWVLNEEGNISAYEFQDGTHTVDMPKAFLTELAALLKARGLLGVFGIHAHHRHGHDPEGVLIEINDPYSRTNIVTNVPVKDSDGEPVTHVLWQFTPPEEEGGIPIITLACHCSGRCVAMEH